MGEKKNQTMQAVKQYLLNITGQDVLYGLRVVLSGMLPLAVSILIKQPELGSLAFIGGLYTSLSDTGGLYQRRLRAMGATALVLALAALLATVAGEIFWLAVALALLLASVGAMLTIFGSVASKVGFMITGIFLVVLAQPAPPPVALTHFGAVLAGGVCALAFSLWPWPFRPYQPARKMVADFYRSLASFMVDLASDTSSTATSIVSKDGYQLSQKRNRVLDARNAAQEALLVIRANEEGSNHVSQQLLLLTRLADRLYAATVIFGQSVAARTGQLAQDDLLAPLRLVPPILRQIAQIIQRDQGSVDLSGLDQARAVLLPSPAASGDHRARIARRHLLRAWEYIDENVRAAVATLEREPEGEQWLAPTHYPYPVANERVWETLRANLSFQSLAFRHALRVGVAVMLGVAISLFFHLPHGYWMPLTTLIILKPSFGDTRERLVQRVGGTVLGGLIAALLAALIYNPLILYLLVFLMGLAAFTYYSRNYTVYAVFMTPFIVLILDLGHPGNWQVALVRMLNTIMGGVIAFLAGYLFWPQWEQERLPDQLARSVAANRAFLDTVFPRRAGERSDRRALYQASREAHLQDANATAAFQRLLREPRARRGDVKRFYALASANRRLCDSITGLELHKTRPEDSAIVLELKRFLKCCDEMLIGIEEAIRKGQPIDSRPRYLARLEASLQVVRAALLPTAAAETGEVVAITPEKRTASKDFSLLAVQFTSIARDISDMYRFLSEETMKEEEERDQEIA
jgi:uncharacterized membrane protein YccC